MLHLGTFCVDVTPPVGFPTGFGTGEPTEAIRDPLFLRGFIFDDGECRCLVASLDYCGLMNSAYDELCAALAQAVETTPDHTSIHCIHQHDAPLLDFEIEAHLGCVTFPRQWWLGVIDACAGSARTAAAKLEEVGELGWNEMRLHGYASNRRILGDDGKVAGMRFSRCGDSALRRAPVGVIDPMLRTLAFRGKYGGLLASMSFYATHPQVSNGRRMYSADAPGEAMRLVSEQHDGLHAFFTGAGGNITAGKYTSTTDLEANLVEFGKRLADGISVNLQGMTLAEAPKLEWARGSFPFPRAAVDRAALSASADDSALPAHKRLLSAVLLSSLEYRANADYSFSLLRIGECRVLFLPGEPFVEYQLLAQSLIPDEFLAVAANCSDNFLYLPQPCHFAEGGYEPTSFCWCTEQFASRFKHAVTELLGVSD
ncbi:MAG: hypothetical protein HN742_13475 [Lentisphaerae bacterium]|jgi:hypothetical protein|nr:hypothetical protein [Lentisphaerota bacterium]MBT4818941.1 hypothetical protein [Lentisphaerota bacterium]MBT5608225.1 hypothetical protein [Lentisphaerota bacterium]MBT7058886.1 hypothetical protein [Lentisphaerota bacterium]MBT7842883.1 hypothetical protein [Lentisphaerota bacterium]